MEDRYQYPIFFECPSLNGEQKKRIENYFQIRRKSGGGDCGPVKKINDKVCSVAFKERDAQQRVLQKSEHVLEFSGGTLVLTVQESPGLTSKSTKPNLDSASSQSKPSIPASTAAPSGEEYELQFDSYLLHYLKECPKAGEELEKKLASMACCAQLHPEEGRVLLQGSAQHGSVDEVRNWKAKVDELFDAYQCHYEVDTHKIKALHQSCSSGQNTDEVKVYSEVGFAVVVGERSQVKARLMEVEHSLVKQRLHSNEKQTTIRRLGKGKLRLLWKEIEQNLGRDFPGVKVKQGDEGQLVLEGSVEQILKAGDQISHMESLVLERKVSNMNPHLLAFLKKAYGDPVMLGVFLGVGDKVEIELRDTELRFFAMSADKLDDSENKLQEKFKEVKINVPNCSSVPSELRENLKSKTNMMNQGRHRAQVVFGSDTTICLLGHTKQVEQLSEAVKQFILGQSSIESQITLPFPELAQGLPELLQLHKFDYSGITFTPLTSSFEPKVILEGPSKKVREVMNRLSPFLDSFVQNRVTIDMPGAAKYFLSPSGRENILNLARSHKCLIQLQEQHHVTRQNLASSTRLCGVNTTVASYSLCDGLQVLVCQGDITKQEADALVNAANEDLDHCGGVAAALSKAGGPEVQRESRALVKNQGKIPVGDVVVTTAGNLNCKNLLHAVGPVGGNSGGNERVLLEKTVTSALDLAELMEFKSIAMPCISSGLFGVPVVVCSEAIVTAVKKFGSEGGRSLSRIILIDNREEVVRALQEACDRVLKGIPIGNITSVPDVARGATAGAPGDVESVHVNIVQGTIETQQEDGLVSPMAGHDPLSTRVGNVLSNVAGPQLTAKLHKESGGATLPGQTVLVEGLSGLRSKGVFFLNLVSWNNNQHGTALQALRQGIRNILTSCDNKGYRSVALPMLGTGTVLRFPHVIVSRSILEEIRAFEQNRSNRTSFVVRIVIHPSDRESSKALQSAQETVHLRGFTNDTNPDQASFYRHVWGTDDEVTAMLGGVKLQMVRGDIVHERTDFIINTTNFSNHFGVSKAILTAAGPAVQAELERVRNTEDSMCTTGPGALGCKEIIHVGFNNDSKFIRKMCINILKQCERKGYHSAAFPAINTGGGCMDSVEVCKAMLDGMTSAITDMKPKSLSLIRIVILQQPVFQAFRSELESRFGLTAKQHLTLREKAKQKLMKFRGKYSGTSTSSTPQGETFISLKSKPAVISVIGCSPDNIWTIKSDLEGILQKQLIERELDAQDFTMLDPMELEALQAKITMLDMSVEYRRCQRSEGVDGNRARNADRDRSRPGRDVYVLKGFKEDVLSAMEFVNRAIQKALYDDLEDKEEAMMALNVQWSIQDVNLTWQEMSLHDNYMLEKAHMRKEVSVDVTAPDGMTVTVNLRTQEATNWQTGATYKVKRNDTHTMSDLPTHWEAMHDEVFKKVELQPNSTEYQFVAQGFLKTAKHNICKIERVQNFYLWHAYTLCKHRILSKNGSADLGEKLLYHGTSAETCNLIEKDRFDRSFAGKHATLYGKGVYFAVNADYSARGYSPPDSSGLRRMYVARVLTGRYTVGNSSMIAPPPRGSDPTDCFDSVVNNQQQPSMFVIFHDDQAYPEYVITFN